MYSGFCILYSGNNLYFKRVRGCHSKMEKFSLLYNAVTWCGGHPPLIYSLVAAFFDLFQEVFYSFPILLIKVFLELQGKLEHPFCFHFLVKQNKTSKCSNFHYLNNKTFFLIRDFKAFKLTSAN